MKSRSSGNEIVFSPSGASAARTGFVADQQDSTDYVHPGRKKGANARLCSRKHRTRLSAFLKRVPRLPSQLQHVASAHRGWLGRGRKVSTSASSAGRRPFGNAATELRLQRHVSEAVRTRAVLAHGRRFQPEAIGLPITSKKYDSGIPLGVTTASRPSPQKTQPNRDSGRLTLFDTH